jgi:hypothetical protein
VNENAFAIMKQARPIPTLGRPVHRGVTPIDYGPVLLRMPFGFHLTVDTLPSELTSGGSRSALAVSGFCLRARLGLSIPSASPASEALNPAFGYGAPHLSAGGTSTLLSNALLSALHASL